MTLNLKKIVFLVFTALIAFGSPRQLMAHRVTIFAWEKGETVRTQSKFSDGKAIKQGRIEVFDSSGQLLLQGLSDDRGEFSFKPPRPAPLKIVLSSGGHRAVWNLRPKKSEIHKPEDDHTHSRSHESQDNRILNREDIRLIVEKAVDEKLDPVFKILAEQSVPRVSLRDVIGGFGYIMGLVGLAAYLLSRKNSRH